MENASKALLIAAGILVGLIVISMIMVSYRQISSYYQTKEQVEISKQMNNFNEKYIPYNRDDVRGSDLLSLINRIVNFNTINPDDDPITISIKIPNNSSAKMFYYNYDKYKNNGNYQKIITLGQVYTQENINEKILNTANLIENQYTQLIATKLAANMSTLMGENTRKEPTDLLDEFKLSHSQLGDIRKKIFEYYQYNQFKRAHFDCKALKYTSAGRVKSFEFEFNGTFE